jgi:protein-disulfide isomerase
MNTKLIVISITAIIGFVVLAYFSTNKPEQTSFPEQAQLRTQDASASGKLVDHTLGKGKHIMIEYSDLQCPACKSFHDYISAEKKKDANFAKIMNEQYTFVYRNFPLITIHKNAEIAARSAEAAAIQGKFYEFLDAGFGSQNEWASSDKAREYFINLAKTLGLDTEKFSQDIDSAAVSQKIEADIALGEQAKIGGTPTFFIDGQKVSNFGSFDEFKKIVIDAAKE